jgi:hypothetical protein
MGQVNPTALGALVVELAGDPQYELHQVRIYRGLPDPRRDPHGNRAAHRQIAAWRRDPAVTVNTRTFQYPRNYPASPPQEKGIDVQLALDFAMMAVRDEYDVGILMSNDTDLRPALEEVMNLGSQTVEVAAWEPLPGRQRYRLRLTGSAPQRQPHCHWIDYSDYQSIQDTTDYTRSR